MQNSGWEGGEWVERVGRGWERRFDSIKSYKYEGYEAKLKIYNL